MQGLSCHVLGYMQQAHDKRGLAYQQTVFTFLLLIPSFQEKSPFCNNFIQKREMHKIIPEDDGTVLKKILVHH